MLYIVSLILHFMQENGKNGSSGLKEPVKEIYVPTDQECQDGLRRDVQNMAFLCDALLQDSELLAHMASFIRGRLMNLKNAQESIPFGGSKAEA